MPKIREIGFTGRAPGPIGGVQASPEAFGASAAQGQKALAQSIVGVGDLLVQRAEQSDLSDLNAKFSATQAQFTADWQERLRTADPGDKTLSDKFIQDYDTHIEKLREGVGTRAGRLYFEKAANDMRSQFSTTTVAAQAELAGVKARDDLVSARDNDSYTLLKDPSAFADVLQRHGEGLDNYVATGGNTAAALKLRVDGEKELAVSAVRGWIRLNPELAVNQLNEDKWKGFIDGDAKHQLLAEAEQSINGDRIEGERRRIESERIAKKRIDAEQDKVLKGIHSGTITGKDISDNTVFDFEARNQMFNILEAQNRGEKPDKALLFSLFDRIHLPEGHPNRIVDERELIDYGPSLGIDGLRTLRGEIQGKGTSEGAREAKFKAEYIQGAEKILAGKDAVTGLVDPKGQDNYQRFFYDFQEQWAEKRKTKSVRELTDPKSPDYMGNLSLKYRRTLDQQIADMASFADMDIEAPTEAFTPGESFNPAAAPLPAAPPPRAAPVQQKRNEGESPAQYLKRIKAGS